MPQNKKDRKVRAVFITLTFREQEFDDRMTTLASDILADIAERYCAVKELGSYGTNPHMHIYADLKQPRRTDKVTDKFKTAYKTLELFTNRYTIKTVADHDAVYRVGYYMQKEIQHEKLFAHNIVWASFLETYQARSNLAQKLIRIPNYKVYKIDELPTAYLAYCDAHKLDKQNVVVNLKDMIYNDKIQVTQFKSLRAVVTKIMIKIGHPEADAYLNNLIAI